MGEFEEGGRNFPLAFWEVGDLADVPTPAVPLHLPFELLVVAPCWEFCGFVDVDVSTGEFEEGGSIFHWPFGV